ncbi:MAG: hypothetical protein IJ526_04495 [Lachnospiraceae bacterium]|nr:hypothetical protein [Lachnospiraceae bacterium]
MSESGNEKRCIQCNKIIVGKSRLGLCPKCADKDARGAAEGAAGLAIAALVIKKAWKPVKTLAKAVLKI